jgi:hypothetical protein
MYELPSLEGVKKCVVTREAVLGTEKPRLIYAEQEALPEPKARKQQPEPIGTALIPEAPTAG